VQLKHTVPHDVVKLDGFALIKHSATYDIYLSIDEFNLVCNPHEILGLKLDFRATFAEYGASYTTHRDGVSLPKGSFEARHSVLEILHQLLRFLSPRTNMYLFRYECEPGSQVSIPENCPPPPGSPSPGFSPRLIAVVVKK
jgi:hypothetical protein